MKLRSVPLCSGDVRRDLLQPVNQGNKVERNIPSEGNSKSDRTVTARGPRRNAALRRSIASASARYPHGRRKALGICRTSLYGGGTSGSSRGAANQMGTFRGGGWLARRPWVNLSGRCT